MLRNKTGQITAILNRQVFMIIVGGVLGYLIAPTLGQDRTLGIAIGGILGFFASKFI